MSEYVFKLPDLGEGTVEAEIVEWHVKTGDEVKEGDVIVDVMTDKANVEVPAPVDGKVLRTSGEPGDIVAVGSELIALEAAAKAPRQRRGAAEGAAPAGNAESPEKGAPPGKGASPETTEQAGSVPSETAEASGSPSDAAASAAASADAGTAADTEAASTTSAAAGAETPKKQGSTPAASATASEAPPEDAPASTRRDKVITSPAIRRRAKEAGVDLTLVSGSGPRGRILRRDLDAALESGTAARRSAPRAEPASGEEFEETKVIGVRRVIAERMSQSKREIPHFAYVEEVDVTELESLRRHLNDTHERRLTVLPFIGTALIRALEQFPQCNARYDSERGMLQTFRPVHLGIATQTNDGLKVPVVRDAQRLDLWQLAEEVARVAAAARDGKAGRNELSGSTITITSLGRMGGIVTTPVINYPEVGIIGVNKAVERPVVIDGQIRVRTIMNLSSSFDHRFVDGFDAAAMIQRVKGLLEHPATLFLSGP